MSDEVPRYIQWYIQQLKCTYLTTTSSSVCGRASQRVARLLLVQSSWHKSDLTWLVHLLQSWLRLVFTMQVTFAESGRYTYNGGIRSPNSQFRVPVVCSLLRRTISRKLPSSWHTFRCRRCCFLC